MLVAVSTAFVFVIVAFVVVFVAHLVVRKMFPKDGGNK